MQCWDPPLVRHGLQGRDGRLLYLRRRFKRVRVRWAFPPLAPGSHLQMSVSSSPMQKAPGSCGKRQEADDNKGRRSAPSSLRCSAESGVFLLLYEKGWHAAVQAPHCFRCKRRHWKVQWISMWTCEDTRRLSGKLTESGISAWSLLSLLINQSLRSFRMPLDCQRIHSRTDHSGFVMGGMTHVIMTI